MLSVLAVLREHQSLFYNKQKIYVLYYLYSKMDTTYNALPQLQDADVEYYDIEENEDEQSQSSEDDDEMQYDEGPITEDNSDQKHTSTDTTYMENSSHKRSDVHSLLNSTSDNTVLEQNSLIPSNLIYLIHTRTACLITLTVIQLLDNKVTMGLNLKSNFLCLQKVCLLI